MVTEVKLKTQRLWTSLPSTQQWDSQDVDTRQATTASFPIPKHLTAVINLPANRTGMGGEHSGMGGEHLFPLSNL